MPERNCATARNPVLPITSYARARLSDKPQNPVAPGCAVAPGVRPAPQACRFTVLYCCRCRDCEKFEKMGADHYRCREGIGGTAVQWGTGEWITQPLPDQWHHCAGYRGPRISKDYFVWRYPQGEKDHAEN